MPTTTSRPRRARSAGGGASSRTRCEPSRTSRPPPGGLEAPAQQVHRRRAHEAGDEDVGRPVVERLRHVALLEPAVAHDGDAITHRHRLGLVVSDVDGRRAELLVQPHEVGAHLDAQLGVEVRERLVHQEGLRLAHDRAPESDALALPAGQLARAARQQVAQAEPVGHRPYPLADGGPRPMRHAESEAHVGRDVHVRIERVALEDHRDVAIPGGDVVDHARADADRPVGGLLEPRDHAQRGRLARP
jgi:hypothetical protein